MMMTSRFLFDIDFSHFFLFWGLCLRVVVEMAEWDTLELIFWTFCRFCGRFWEKQDPQRCQASDDLAHAGACSSCATGLRRSIPYMPLGLEVARLYCPKETDVRRALQAMKLKVSQKAPRLFPCEPSTRKHFFATMSWTLVIFWPSQPPPLPQELDRLARLSQELFCKMLAEQSTLAIVSNVPSTQLEPVVGRVFASLAKHPPGDLHPSPARLLAMADPLPGKTVVPPCLVESRENPGISFTWSVPFQDSGG